MADDKPTGSRTSRSGGMKIDSALVRELAELLSETNLTEIEVEEADRKIRVSRAGVATAAVAPVVTAAPVAAQASEASASAGDATPANAVKSPMVGTVYLSPEPGAAPFIAVGKAVKAGETLLIVEAMKVMNPIRATRSGRVAKILVGNGDPVEYGELLLIID